MWYYSSNGKQSGPCTQVEFDDFVGKGIITRDTLVWKDGMEDWQTMGQACLGDSLPPPLPPVPPGVAEKVGVWKEGDLVVARDGALFPRRCVKCNAPAEGAPMPRKLSWHHPALLLLVLVNLLVYLVVALCVRKNVSVEVHLCDRHRKKLSLYKGVVISGCLASLAAAILGFSLDIPFLGLAGVLAILGFLLAGCIGCNVVKATRIEGGVAWIKGAGADFLRDLPEKSR